MTQELKEDVKSIVSILVQLDEVGVSLMNNNANLLLARQNMSEKKELNQMDRLDKYVDDIINQ